MAFKLIQAEHERRRAVNTPHSDDGGGDDPGGSDPPPHTVALAVLCEPMNTARIRCTGRNLALSYQVAPINPRFTSPYQESCPTPAPAVPVGQV